MRTIALILLFAGTTLAAELPEPVARREGSLAVPGKEIAYAVTAGRMTVRDVDGGERARIFHVDYVVPAADGAPPRPVTFAFNGGPGSSSVWLHLGALGPRIVTLGEEGLGTGGSRWPVANADSWLPFTDLVFIDPVSTGYSRPAKGRKPKEFHGLSEDARSVADFIRQWLTENVRWTSPLFLVGESYGTTRAAELSGQLHSRGIDLTGIVLVSPVLHFGTTSQAEGNDLGYRLYLPTLAATAFYHGRVKTQKPLPAFLDEVEAFVSGDYLLALAKGDRLPAEERERIAARIAAYTGLRRDYVLRANLRVGSTGFRKELLRDRRRTVGRLDSRFTGIDRKAAGSYPESDPSMEAIRGPFTAALFDYLRRELRYESKLTYQIFGNVHPWSFARHENRYVNTAATLRRAMAQNARLKVLCAMGYYDLATPYYAVEYTVAHMELPPERRPNLSFAYYEAGHMMYLRAADRAKLAADAAAFYADALAGK